MTYVSRADFVYLMNTGMAKSGPEIYTACIEGEWQQVAISSNPNSPYITPIDRKP